MSPIAIATAAALLAFVPAHTPATLSASRVHVHAQMGFFDSFKDAFENEPKLQAKAKAQGKKAAPNYVQKKVQQRKAYEKETATAAKKTGEIQTGNERLDELLSGWTWK